MAGSADKNDRRKAPVHTRALPAPAPERPGERRTGAGAANRKTGSGAVVFHALTPDRWRDVERLFGPRGACAGCWCMWWRLPAKEFRAGSGDGNRDRLRALVRGGPPPGILAYVDGEPAGWCALAPRADYPRLARSRILAPVDTAEVWSISCFFVARQCRRSGLSSRLIRAALDHARAAGARVIEAYPVDPAGPRVPDAFIYTGIASTFARAGFVEVARRSPTRPLMRRNLGRSRRER